MSGRFAERTTFLIERKVKYLYLFLPVIFFLVTADLKAREAGTQILKWRELSDLPDTRGVAGAFSGVSNDVLIVAGGTNFPEPLFKDGQVNPKAKKTWYDTVYVLKSGKDDWQTAEPLPYPLGYGASVTTPEGLVCIGGSNAREHFSEVFLLEFSAGNIKRTSLPALPGPAAHTAGALLGNTIYVAGGQSSPDSKEAMKNFWALDLSREDPCWHILEPWPGPGRILPVVAVQDGSFFLFSGCELLTDENGNVHRKYLTDGYRFTPHKGKPFTGRWTRVADVPIPVAGAPTCAGGRRASAFSEPSSAP
jgi:N-acetylneuraminic acid mutarotase